MPERPVTFEMRVGDGEYDGRSVGVLPLRIVASSQGEAVERFTELLEALEGVVEGFEWAEVLVNPRDCMEACALGERLYRGIVLREAAEAARNQ